MIKAVVICEDHTLDEYIIKPIVAEIFRENSQQVKVQVVSNPRIHGVAQALAKETHTEVLDSYPMANVFFLIVDRDGRTNRHAGNFRKRTLEAADAGKSMLGCLAIEEIEVWALALHRNELAADWNMIRSERNPKEVYFEPFAKRKGWQTAPGNGRKSAIQKLGKNEWESLKSLCPELGKLATDVKEWLKTRQ